MKEELSSVGCHLTVLSGPNHAEEIGRNLPAAAVVGTTSMDIGKKGTTGITQQRISYI